MANYHDEPILSANSTAYDLLGMSFRKVVDWVQRAAPEDVADLLLNMADEANYLQELVDGYTDPSTLNYTKE